MTHMSIVAKRSPSSASAELLLPLIYNLYHDIYHSYVADNKVY